MTLTQLRVNVSSIINEIFGDRTDHPLIVRFIAFLVDYALFFAFATPTYLIFDSPGTRSIPLIITISISIIYFTLGNSKLFKGQTIGKRLLRIRVIDNHCQYLEVWRSFLRCLSVVLLINGMDIMSVIVREQSDFYVPVFYTFPMILVGVFYFPLLTTNRQNFYDMFVGSYVVPRDRVVKNEMKLDWAVFFIFMLIYAAFIVFMLNLG
jgi:uncharacterized RDD family membrane protein YckC